VLPDSSFARPTLGELVALQALGALGALGAVEALERELTVLRMLRVEVEQFRPGLLPDDGTDGWRSSAAERYAERLDELRIALAGAERLLLDAESGLVRHLERLRSEAGGAWTN
jgi:hypothetical protein